MSGLKLAGNVYVCFLSGAVAFFLYWAFVGGSYLIMQRPSPPLNVMYGMYFSGFPLFFSLLSGHLLRRWKKRQAQREYDDAKSKSVYWDEI